MRRLILLLGLFVCAPSFAQLSGAVPRPARPEWWTSNVNGPLLTIQQYSNTSRRPVLTLKKSDGTTIWYATIEGHTFNTGFLRPGPYTSGTLPAISAADAGGLAWDSTTTSFKYVSAAGAWTPLVGSGSGTGLPTFDDFTACNSQAFDASIVDRTSANPCVLTLSGTPFVGSHVLIQRDSSLLLETTTYTVSGNSVTFVNGYKPVAAEKVRAIFWK